MEKFEQLSKEKNIKKAEEYCDKGVSFGQEGDFDRAIEWITKAVELLLIFLRHGTIWVMLIIQEKMILKMHTFVGIKH